MRTASLVGLAALLLISTSAQAESGWWAQGLVVKTQAQKDKVARMDVTPMKTEEARHPVGTAGTDVRTMLQAVRDGKRADIAIPKQFGDLAIEVETRWYEFGTDLDGDGTKDRLMLRSVRVPDLDEKVTTVAWLVAVRVNEKGAVGPDEEKTGFVLAAAEREGREAPIQLLGIRPATGSVDVVAWSGGKQAAVRLSLEKGEGACLCGVRKLADTAAKVFDRMVLAPETSYVKAFVRKEFQAEVDKVEAVAGLAIPEVLRPLYMSLKRAEKAMVDCLAKPEAPAWANRSLDATQVLLRKADQALTLSSEEFRYRVEGLQKVSQWWRDKEASLTYEGKKMRRIDVEIRISQTADDAERLKLAKTYEDHFAGLYADGGAYHLLIDRLNDIARAHGYRNFGDLRLEAMFGISADAFRAWVDEAFAATQADAKAFIEELKKKKVSDQLGYWEVSYLRKAWRAKEIDASELPKLTEEQARDIMARHLLDLGFDLTKEPLSRITMDYYSDPLKLSAGGVAATATPQDAYFTSNLKPGEPIPLNEFETMLHETLHTIHYQVSGQASGGSSAFQNLMYSYIAEGITMSGQGLPTGSPELMKRYFDGLPGFTPQFMEAYPRAQRQAEAWGLRRLLAMALMEANLYEDRHPDGTARTWKERLDWWPELLAEKLWVAPDGIQLGQILCRMHPTAEQQQLQYASYPLGRILVGGLRDAVITTGTEKELAAYGEQLRILMARGALADQPFVKVLIENIK